MALSAHNTEEMQYIDLSHDICNNMPVYPGDAEVSLIQTKKLAEDEYNAYSFFSSLHAGTHVDCPMHLLPETKTIADYPIQCFVGNGVLIDARNDRQIGFKSEYHERIKNDDIVLIYTGMSKKYGSHDYYYRHHVVADELAQFFVSKKIKMLGIDMPSPDFPPFQIHKLLLKNDIFIIENMTNLEQLINIDRFEIFAQPLKIEGEASLVRAFARYILPQDK